MYDLAGLTVNVQKFVYKIDPGNVMVEIKTVYFRRVCHYHDKLKNCTFLVTGFNLSMIKLDNKSAMGTLNVK